MSSGPWTARASCGLVRLGSGESDPPPPSFMCLYFVSLTRKKQTKFFWIIPVYFHVSSSTHSSLGVPISDTSRSHWACHCLHKAQGDPCTRETLWYHEFLDSSSSCPPFRAVSWIVLPIISLFLNNHILELAERRDLVVSHLRWIPVGFLSSLQPAPISALSSSHPSPGSDPNSWIHKVKSTLDSQLVGK